MILYLAVYLNIVYIFKDIQKACNKSSTVYEVNTSGDKAKEMKCVPVTYRLREVK